MTSTVRAWDRRSLQRRIVTVVLLGMAGSLALIGLPSWIGMQRLARGLLEERHRLAAAAAARLEHELLQDMERLQEVATAQAMGVAPADQPRILRAAFRRSRLLEAVVLIGADFRPLFAEPADADVLPAFERIDAALQAFRSGRPAASALIESDAGPVVFLFVPFRSGQTPVAGLVAGEIRPDDARLLEPLEAARPGPAGSVALEDTAGQTIVSSRPRGEATGDDVSVRSAMAGFGWSVVIRQPASEALGPLRMVRSDLLWLAPLLTAVAAVFAWGAARSVRQPLLVLTRAAERIASGDLSHPLSGLGDDEVGRLARALDDMRAALRVSLATIEEDRAQLEVRVRERTQELSVLSARLRERDAARSHLLSRLISAQEDERKRVARELHDETSQSLNALVMSLDAATTSFPSAESRQRLDEAKGLALRLLDGVHRLIIDLRPLMLDDLGLIPAIRWFAQRHLLARGIGVQFECPDDLEPRLSPQAQTAVFRTAQEAIVNIARHADAETVLLQCLTAGDRLVIEIEDDGRGFDLAAASAVDGSQRGIGLLGMRERIELIGGRLTVDSAPGEGTRVVIDVPLAEVEANA
jgi:signal transduction histidine kinase